LNGFEYTFGIEEEFFLARASSGLLATRVPEELLKTARAQLGDCITSELLQSQIEIASPVLGSIDDARSTLRHLRAALSELVAQMGFRLIASSTHPLGAWREQLVTEKPRYDQLISDFRIVGQRNLVCGMHVHVAVPPGIDRVALMNRAMPWLPVFLALSTSSPFWDRRVTGLMSYRQAIYDEWPRSGVPDFFRDEEDYRAFCLTLQRAGAIRDASYFWWAIRPAVRYPTLELRIADVCTRVEDTLAIAALFRCLIAALIADPEAARHYTTHTRRLIDENRWRAKRDGMGAELIDEASGRAWPMRDVLGRMLKFVANEAERLDCAAALRQLDHILEAGTSSHSQLRIYNERRAAGDSRSKALRRVVDWLAQTTAS